MDLSAPSRFQFFFTFCLVRPLQEKSGVASEGRTAAESSGSFPACFRLSSSEVYPEPQAADPTFSHLPMHSQQAKVPCLMIPIGGIQMVQARPRSHPTTPSSPTSPPLEGPSLARFESHWGRTPRTQRLRTAGDQWPEQQAAGTSQPGPSPKLESVTTDLKQHGSSSSSSHTRSSDTDAPRVPDRGSSSREGFSQAAPRPSCVRGHQPQGEEPHSTGAQVERGAPGTSKDQRT